MNLGINAPGKNALRSPDIGGTARTDLHADGLRR